MSNEEFEKICKKCGIAVKDGKIDHPLFGDVYEILKKQVEDFYADEFSPLTKILIGAEKAEPESHWLINRPGIERIGDWVYIGTNIDNKDIWRDTKTNQTYKGNLN